MTAKEIKAMSEWVDMMKVMLDACNDRMEAELAEAEKPEPEVELEHGDYGVWNSGHAWAALRRDEKIEAFGDKKGSGMLASKMGADKITRLGNIFAELEALSEDVEEITVEGNQGERVVFRANDQGGLYVSIGMDSVSAKSANAIIPLGTVLKLRQMAATAARKSGKQD